MKKTKDFFSMRRRLAVLGKNNWNFSYCPGKLNSIGTWMIAVSMNPLKKLHTNITISEYQISSKVFEYLFLVHFGNRLWFYFQALPNYVWLKCYSKQC
jgi:hypothetical protein